MEGPGAYKRREAATKRGGAGAQASARVCPAGRLIVKLVTIVLQVVTAA
eukprot:COSAG06_NODE_1428_length_9487_cov_195.907861_14_plen_49_part_00